MSFRSLAVAGVALAAIAGAPAMAQSVSNQLEATEEAAGNAFDVDAEGIEAYVRANVVDDATFAAAPEVGATVGADMTLMPVEGYDAYSYTYFEGRPVIVRNDTRTIVSMGEPE